MSFGRNPYVPRAQAAEQKAADAADDGARARALREAAHQWDRAAEREAPGKRRVEYEQNAQRNRDEAENKAHAPGAGAPGGSAPPPTDPHLLN